MLVVGSETPLCGHASFDGPQVETPPVLALHGLRLAAERQRRQNDPRGQQGGYPGRAPQASLERELPGGSGRCRDDPDFARGVEIQLVGQRKV